jgi:UDP-N-acetylmuramate--alanine ligase
MLGKTERIHFVGIGGISMSGLATIMHNLRFRVTGSDIQRSEITRRLEKMGIKVDYGHNERNVKDADVVVYSTAISKDNPELAEARRIDIPVIHRGEMLAELTRLKIAICISGTHGKTTTTSMIGEVLQKGGLSPTTIVGGIIKGKSQAQLGKGNYVVCEADESDKSFLKLFPAYSIITNIEHEHLDHYRDIEEIKDHFTYFATHVPFWGCAFLGADSPFNLEIQSRIPRRTVLYGLNKLAVLRAEKVRRSNFGSRFNVKYFDKSVGEFKVGLPGKHNVMNALAAIGIGIELDIETSNIQKALENFRGVRRRLEHHGDIKGAKIFDDYGHHPTEIAVTLETLREYFPKRRIISVFQPHRYTRTRYLYNEFAIAFLHADILVVTEIYPAHEIPIPGVTGESLAKRISKEHKSVYSIVDFDDIIDFLRKTIRRGDIIVIQGAGDINQLAKRLRKEL